MKMTMGIIVTALSGKAGGLVASRNRYGPYLRNYAVPVNPSSERQGVIRNRMADLTAWWNQQLSDAERELWNTYALNTPLQGRNGSINTVTGFNMFVRTNCLRLESGLAVLEAAPALYTLPETDPTLAFTASAASQELSVAFDNTKEWAGEVGGKMVLYMGEPQVNNRNFFGGPWHFADTIDGAVVPPASPATIAVPKAIAVGQKLWAYARVLRADGRLSGQFRAGPVTVGA